MKSKTVRQAIILAAGLGTRLQPLTWRIPKPALPVGGLPIIFYNLMLLKEAGIQRVMVNLYHCPKVLVKLLSFAQKLKLQLDLSFEKKILGTGGGIAQALAKMPSESTLILNGDILTDFNLKTLIASHQRSHAKASLVCLPPDKAKVHSYIFYHKNRKIISISDKSPLNSSQRGIFAGIHIFEPELFRNYPNGKFGCIIRQVYQPALERGELLLAHPYQGAWWDLGNLDTLKFVDTQLWQQRVSPKLIKIRKELLKLYSFQ